METPPRPDRSLPSPWPPAAPPAAVPPTAYAPPPAWDDLPDPDLPPPRRLTPRVVARALRRHWWQALLLWAAGSVALMTLVYVKVKPLYTARAWLKVDPTSNSPLLGVSAPAGDLDLFMQTQVQLVTSPEVLQTAARDPKVVNLPKLRAAEDPEEELRRSLAVVIPPKTNLILISLASTLPTEAATIVNAVADAYLRSSSQWIDADTRELIEQTKKVKERFDKEMVRLRDELERLNEAGATADPRGSAQVALGRYRAFRSRLDQIELELMDAEATVQTLTALRDRTGSADRVDAAPAELTDAQLDELVRQAFLADPDVLAVHRQLVEARQRYESAGRTAVGHDPAIEKFRRDKERLEQQNRRLWEQKQPILRDQIARSGPKPVVDPVLRELTDAQLRLDKLKAERAEVETALDGIRQEHLTEGNEALQARFKSEDLTFATETYKKASLALEQLEFEARGTKVSSIASAEPTMRTTSDNRLKLMAAAPVGMFAAVLALFVLLELRGARVADPEELSSRLRLGVLGVVPPLPSLEPPRGPKALRDQRRRLEEFVQSLDHLRVTLCAVGPAGTPARRCVMITSAVGGEGKTTLAAQLAGRCANAGLTTLLVDADLRRPSLGELLEVPEGPGLAEILAGEATPEEAMVVIGNAGGFHLLPAGAAGYDPSRLLQGERLGQLVARLREAFDVVLIDVPPVLPVPDALLVGRWTDGAVVAVRHDSSRYPLVERAHKRLTSIGVPLLGAVLNGARPAESSYGAYDYYAATTAPRGTDRSSSSEG